MSIYEGYLETMTAVMDRIVHLIEENSRRHEAEHGEKLYEHLSHRIKGDDSMREKLARLGVDPTARNALRAVTDAIGLRVVCLFIDDVYENVQLLKSLPGCSVVQEKDYIRNALRTIAMDTWAALEHELKYKKHIANPELIAQELHRCANELASCDVSMQTLRKIIREL